MHRSRWPDRNTSSSPPISMAGLHLAIYGTTLSVYLCCSLARDYTTHPYNLTEQTAVLNCDTAAGQRLAATG